MTDFVYKSTIYGPRKFSVEEAGGIVTLDGKQLSAFGGYFTPGRSSQPLRADGATLEVVARRWWKQRTGHLQVFGHKANGIDP